MSSDSGAIYAALAKVQKGLQSQSHTRRVNVGRYGYSYTELSALVDYLLPQLGAAGIAVTHTMRLSGEENDRVAVVCRLTADDGSHVESVCYMQPDGWDPQSIGKAYTYGRRYTIQAACGLATEADDDYAPAGSEHSPTKAQQPQVSQVSQPAPAANGGTPRVSAANAGKAATEAQVRAVFARSGALLGKEVPRDEVKFLVEAYAKREVGAATIGDLTVATASKLIERLNGATREDLIHADQIPF